MSDDELQEHIANRAREQYHELVRTQGFEVVTRDLDSGPEPYLCQGRVWRKSGRKWKHEPCGQSAIMRLNFQGPENPEGTAAPLCRACVGKLARDLVKLIELE